MSANADTPPPASDDPARAFARLREAWTAKRGLGLDDRRAGLIKLRAAIKAHAEDFARALDADFGGRSRHETLVAEIATILAALDHAVPRLARWASPERVAVGWRFWPARARIVSQPLGVVAILGPANFPVQLTVLPLIGAVAAGCRVLVKPSELTPATADLLSRCLAEAFAPDHVATVQGGADVAVALTNLPLDHILFTGSTANGRKVMAAAAGQLTPVTLELGGKSPAVIDVAADVDAAARAIVTGKLMNAGQTCVAPDYVLVPTALRETFVSAAVRHARALYPDPDGPGYTAVRGAAARARLLRLRDGQTVVPLLDTSSKTAAALVIEPAPASPVMQEEIFGPLLPVISYGNLDEAIRQIDSLPAPLALYWFGPENARLADLLARTRSGTVAVNETVLHAAIAGLPFGGVGASGMGAYHGRAGFDTFSHRRPIFVQSRWSPTRLLQPPYRGQSERIIRLLLR